VAPPAGPDVELQLSVSAAERPFALRTAAIVARQITQRCNATVRQPPNTRQAAFGAPAIGTIVLQLRINTSLGEEAYSISNLEGVFGPAAGSVVIAGGDARGLLYGAGRLLRASSYDGPRSTPFTPGKWRGAAQPALPGSFRAHYFAVHYDNFYQSAPEDAVATYMEDIALWGVNTIIVGLPGPGTFSPGKSTVVEGAPQLAVLINRTRSLLRLAVDIGLSPGVVFAPNQGYDAGTATHREGHSPFPHTPFPDPLRVRGDLGALTCPFKGHAYLLELRKKLITQYKDIGLDWFVFWPYDEGGCGCSDDWPWGGKGFPRISSKMATMGREVFPKLRTVVSTWCFDKPVVNGSEYAGMDAFIKAEVGASSASTSNFSFAMVDDHGDFPLWPLEQGGGKLGGLPLLNFPEISMWGRGPWGGWGANPLPTRFEGLWAQTKGKVVGGMPYSEGIYEDMNAVIAWQHYWDSSRNANETLRDYVSFEYSAKAEDVEGIMEAIGLLELTWPGGPHDLGTNTALAALATKAYALLGDVDKRLSTQAKAAWRWRILLLRAEIDATIVANPGKMYGPVLCRDFAELTAIQHVNKSDRCGVPKWPCTKPPPGPPPAPAHACAPCTAPDCPRCVAPAPAATECPAEPHEGGFVPWVRAVNQSNMFGVKEGAHNVGIPLLGIFDAEAGCRAACEALPNCTQYGWNGVTAGSPWSGRCYGRCDAVSPAGTEGGTGGEDCPVSARRVKPAADLL
jgi:hypothetical protein